MPFFNKKISSIIFCVSRGDNSRSDQGPTGVEGNILSNILILIVTSHSKFVISKLDKRNKSAKAKCHLSSQRMLLSSLAFFSIQIRICKVCKNREQKISLSHFSNFRHLRRFDTCFLSFHKRAQLMSSSSVETFFFKTLQNIYFTILSSIDFEDLVAGLKGPRVPPNHSVSVGQNTADTPRQVYYRQAVLDCDWASSSILSTSRSRQLAR